MIIKRWRILDLRFFSILVISLSCFGAALAQQPTEVFSVFRIRYDGGGDWYGNKTTFINLLSYISSELNIPTSQKEVSGSLMDDDLFNYPTAYIAGHGNIKFNEAEAARLRTYLTNGGFLFADDDYGMDASFRLEMKKVFPELKFVDLPFLHPIYHVHFKFPNGLPKIHEHDGGPARGLGLIYEGRLVVFYSFNTDISDGCEDADIHNDPPEKRRDAMRMGLNILLYSLIY